MNIELAVSLLIWRKVCDSLLLSLLSLPVSSTVLSTAGGILATIRLSIETVIEL